MGRSLHGRRGETPGAPQVRSVGSRPAARPAVWRAAARRPQCDGCSLTEQPTCAASSLRVRSSALRRCRTHAPNENSSLMDCSMPECEIQRRTRAVEDCGRSASTGYSAPPPSCGVLDWNTFCETDCNTNCSPLEADLWCNRATLKD